MGNKVRVHVIFKGRVQGVFFRQNTKEKADEEGITGWVRNRHDGNVEAVFEGEKDIVEDVIEWCKTYQPYARVTDVELRYEPYTGSFSSFEIRY